MALTRVEQLIAALNGPVQDVENALQQLLLQRWLSSAQGAQLDLLGKIVGQARGGLSDSSYSQYISARIATNLSQGRYEDLILVAKLLLTANNITGFTIVTSQLQPACVIVSVLNVAIPTATAQIIAPFLFAAKDAGVRIVFIFSNFTPPTTFTYDGTSAQAYDNGHYAGALP